MTTAERKLRRDALAILRAGIDAANAGNAVRRNLRVRGHSLTAGPVNLAFRNFDRIFAIAVGKAAADMVRAIEDILGERLEGGLAVTKRGHRTCEPWRMPLIEAAHPIPDQTSLAAAERIRTLAAGLNARDLLIFAVSGGASALVSAPASPVTLADKQKTTGLLLRAGADIFELNAVRKHLSLLKGGRLAASAYPATIVTLLLSDVVGDRLDIIGSGPTAPDSSTFSDALAALNKYRLLARVPVRVREYLEGGARGLHPETPKPGDPVFRQVHHVVAGSNRLALEASAKAAKKLGYRALLLASGLEGETREVAQVHAKILREAISSGNPVRPPACLLSGGETTVTVRGAGTGGRNQEFALAAAISLAGLPNAVALSAGTDGTDGATDAAGAIASGTTIQRAARLGFDAKLHLLENDSYPFFDALGDLIRTGPTGTNVMDIHLLLAR